MSAESYGAITSSDISWYDSNQDVIPDENSDTDNLLQSQRTSFSLTGGGHASLLTFSLAVQGDYVVDFRSSALIGVFRHWLYDENGQKVAYFQGGLLEQNAINDYFLRNGRHVNLTAGSYTLVT
ncbi:hypothetical protein [Vibrio galatheae]|uniref:hypothetical protein n=1 Tax=Vibrio galatheae TaxID=579748 RepID=UPI000698C898|nr:hypothetical protein [Vibrio galatheae]